MMTYGSPSWHDWILDEDAARPIVKRAVESGINFFDTADIYSVGVSEEITGRLLREFTNRDEVVVATKIFSQMNPDEIQKTFPLLVSVKSRLKELAIEKHASDFKTGCR